MSGACVGGLCECVCVCCAWVDYVSVCVLCVGGLWECVLCMGGLYKCVRVVDCVCVRGGGYY